VTVEPKTQDKQVGMGLVVFVLVACMLVRFVVIKGNPKPKPLPPQPTARRQTSGSLKPS
jgi:hypothetical protein